MDRLIYTAASGMSSSMARQRVIASNMANSQTIGFRAEVLESSPKTLDGASLEVRAMIDTQVRGADMREGSITQTGRDLDIALNGDAMLAVQAEDGSEVYTRRGDLTISATGLLENGDGLPVIGQSGPISVPLGAKITISPDGAVLASDPQAASQPASEVARLKLASWRGSDLRKDISGQFRVPNDGVLPADENARITPGALEQSNVSPTQILVEMVEAQRLFDIRSKLISTARELDERGASLMRIS
ncbi:MAG: flagellar basal body rod protein FlgF [Sphingomonadaceae bacterium]|nr:flagellar basal body rod protein FlgF [Sphingomonadaceae bacterium]